MFFIITDTHFGHLAFKKNGMRPLNYEEQIFINWQRLVKNDDTVIHLGDIVEGDDLILLGKVLSLPGRKIFIRGNHDTDYIIKFLQAKKNFCCDELVMTFSGIRILFTHKPKYRHEYDINIHGHLHSVNSFSSEKLFLPVALEHMGYSPIPIDKKFLYALKQLVDGFWLYNEVPSLEKMKELDIISNCDENGVFKDASSNKSELLLRRTKLEWFIDKNFFDNYAMRDLTTDIKKLFLHGKISFDEFKEKIIKVSKHNYGEKI